MASPLGLTKLELSYTSSDGDTSDPNFSGSYNSIFNGSKFYYKPRVGSDKKTNENTQNKEIVSNAKGDKKHQPDNSTDDLYDISTESIITYTEDKNLPALTLKAADFAYLRDFGVYPHNRLIACRRFPSPVENDLTAVRMSPISTVISWIPDVEESFFSFQASEQWETNNTNDPLNDLTDIFNKMFSKVSGVNAKNEMSGMVGGAAKLFPVGGIAEALETEVTNILLGKDGKDGTNFNYDNLSVGNPNFMGESAYRDMNSIKSSISIPVKAVYEMKYIKGIDPTIVFMDLVQNLLRFSSSQSVFYISQTGGGKVNKFFNKFKEGDWVGAIKIVVNSVIEAVEQLVSSVGEKIGEFIDKVDTDSVGSFLSSSGEAAKEAAISGLKAIASSSLSRYRIEFAKIIPASTGASSAPWHVTIGNPKNPFFSSGDMIVEGGEVKFNNTLGFNDLPTRIEFSFKIKSARNLGIQEIFDKFNTGAGRQYQRNSIKFNTDFYQGSVNNTNGGETSNAVTGGQNNSVNAG